MAELSEENKKQIKTLVHKHMDRIKNNEVTELSNGLYTLTVKKTVKYIDHNVTNVLKYMIEGKARTLTRYECTMEIKDKFYEYGFMEDDLRDFRGYGFGQCMFASNDNDNLRTVLNKNGDGSEQKTFSFKTDDNGSNVDKL